MWRVMCQSNWQAYADRHGFDLIGIAHRPDMSPRGQARSPAWQKLLVLDQPWSAAYDRIVWIDADIVIAGDAPNILREVPDPTKIGASISGAQFSEAEKHIYFERLHNVTVDPQLAPLAWRFTEDNGYAESEIDGRAPDAQHRGAGDEPATPQRPAQGDLRHGVGLTPLRAAGPVAGDRAARTADPITPRFNWVIHERRFLDFADIETVEHPDMPRLINHLRNELSKAYFLHFAGSMSIMQHLARLSQETGEPWWTPQG
uniref:Uncharacterized protein n=1 Tax=Phenylobacterium glaciei TaxID=2803784 RepID=A0A974P7H0_9CAUL|nr:hypothetical protein JKL49_13545 [Phenylobacterium glaciei]